MSPKPNARSPIQTSHEFPPIPDRRFDWVAFRDPEAGPRGYGRTEAEAVADLREQEDDPDEAHEAENDAREFPR